jgi:hypothetical protein
MRPKYPACGLKLSLPANHLGNPASKLSRPRPLGRGSASQRIQYCNHITRGLAISTDFAQIFAAYVEANGGNAVVPKKPIQTPENEANYAAWTMIHKLATAFRKRYPAQTLSQEDFEQLEAMRFIWFRSEWMIHMGAADRAGDGGVQSDVWQSGSTTVVRGACKPGLA